MPFSRLPDKVIDNIVDEFSTDKYTLRLLLQTARVFQRRCRTHIFRNVLLQVTDTGALTEDSRLLHNLVAVKQSPIGTAVARLHCQFSYPPPDNPHEDRRTRTSLPKSTSISPMIGELTASLTSVREMLLEGLDVTSLSVSVPTLHGLLPPKEPITRLAMRGSHWTCSSTKKFLRFILGYRHITSLELSAVKLAGALGTSKKPRPDVHASDAKNGPIIGQLALIGSDVFLGLIPRGYLGLRKGLRRFLLVVDVDSSVNERVMIRMERTIDYLKDGLTFLFLTPPEPGATNKFHIFLDNILQIPTVIFQCGHPMLAEMWLRQILRDVTRNYKPRLQLTTLGFVIPHEYLVDLYPHFFSCYIPALTEWGGREILQLQFIAANPDHLPLFPGFTEELDNMARQFEKHRIRMEFRTVHREINDMYLEYMDN